MKYIKLYENYKRKTTKEDILSCFHDLEDMGYDVEIRRYCITIIKNPSQNEVTDISELFDFNEIKETLLFAIPYMKSEFDGFIINKISINGYYLDYDLISFNSVDELYEYFENNDTIIGTIQIFYDIRRTPNGSASVIENFNYDSNAGEDNNQSLNPALKKEVEEYVNDLIEKDYKKLLNMLDIKKHGREIDVDELKEKAIEYFLEVPDRMRKLNIPFNSVSRQTNVIPKTNNIGGCLRERL